MRAPVVDDSLMKPFTTAAVVEKLELLGVCAP